MRVAAESPAGILPRVRLTFGDGDSERVLFRRLSASRFIVYGFLALVAGGTAFLKLPWATTDGISLLNAFFVAVRRHRYGPLDRLYPRNVYPLRGGSDDGHHAVGWTRDHDRHDPWRPCSSDSGLGSGACSLVARRRRTPTRLEYLQATLPDSQDHLRRGASRGRDLERWVYTGGAWCR